MAERNDQVTIQLQLNKEVDIPCYPNPKTFIDPLIKVVGGVAMGNFGDVIISPIEPDSDAVSKLWVKTNGARNTFTLNFFINGAWVEWAFEAANQYELFDALVAVPAGWKAIGKFKSEDVPVEDVSGSSSLPKEFYIAKFIGF